MEEKKNAALGCLFIIIVAILVIWFIYPKGDAKLSIDAYRTTQIHVEKFLKASATAKFPDYNKNFIKKTGENSFEINAYVDSQNGFGAMVRSNYLIKMHKKDNNWICDYFELNGERVQ